MKVLLTLAAQAFVGSIAGALIGLLLALAVLPFSSNETLIGVAFYAPILVGQIYFAINAANELQEEEFMAGYFAHHGQ